MTRWSATIKHSCTGGAHRPAEEYQQVTRREWREFEEHFDRRKVELGNCARPYGTRCQHEHACFAAPSFKLTTECSSA